jgi:threonyl-tRNA synthetase
MRGWVVVLPVIAKQDAPARALCDELRSRAVRADLSVDGSLGARIRQSHRRRDALIGVVGGAEATHDTVRITDVIAEFTGTVPVAALCQRVEAAHARRLPTIAW